MSSALPNDVYRAESQGLLYEKKSYSYECTASLQRFHGISAVLILLQNQWFPESGYVQLSIFNLSYFRATPQALLHHPIAGASADRLQVWISVAF